MLPSRAYIGYVDDSGNEDVGWLWSALILPVDRWSEHLHRWLQFRRWLYKQHRVPAEFELRAGIWLGAAPARHTPHEQLALVETDGELVSVLQRDRHQRRARSIIYEKALKAIASLDEAQLFTVADTQSTGPAKFALYDELLCMLEGFLVRENAYLTLIVDGLQTQAPVSQGPV